MTSGYITAEMKARRKHVGRDELMGAVRDNFMYLGEPRSWDVQGFTGYYVSDDARGTGAQVCEDERGVYCLINGEHVERLRSVADVEFAARFYGPQS